MKLFATILLFFGASLASEIAKSFEGSIKACVAEAGLEPELTNKILKGDLSGMTPPQKCLLKCIMIKDGFMSADGSFIEAEVDKKLVGAPPEKIKEVKACGSLKGADLCETAYLVGECSVKAIGVV